MGRRAGPALGRLWAVKQKYGKNDDGNRVQK